MMFKQLFKPAPTTQPKHPTKSNLDTTSLKLEQWMNQLVQQAPSQKTGTLAAYEPELLCICCDTPPPTGNDAVQWDEQSIDYILRQCPLLRQVSFYGQQDPLVSLPRLLDLCRYLHQQRPDIAIHLYTSGESLQQWGSALLQAPINTLVLQLGGHTPSAFHQTTHQPAQTFLQRYSAVYDLLTKRIQSTLNHMTVVGSLAVNQHNFQQLPDMLRWSEQLGLDAVVFHNGQLPWANVSEASPVLNDDFIHEHLEAFHTMVSRLKPDQYRIPFRLPSVFDNVHGCGRQQCGFPYHAMTLTQDMSTHTCPRLKVTAIETKKLWEGDVWNSQQFQYLRAVHGHYQQVRSQQPLTEVLPLLPKACHGCDLNRVAPPAWQNAHLLKQPLPLWV
ncbi:MAG: hypothetical protein ACKO34_09280 [Vampirovibrionales bacterium]